MPSNRRAPRVSREKTAPERMPRELESRETEVREFTDYSPPSALPDPKPQPGYEFRWIRGSILNSQDNRNVSMRFREGWEPVRLSDHPELQLTTDDEGQYARMGGVEVGGLVLCKMPTERARARDEYFRKVTKAQMASVDANLFREENSIMPILKPDRRTETRFGPDEN